MTGLEPAEVGLLDQREHEPTETQGAQGGAQEVDPSR